MKPGIDEICELVEKLGPCKVAALYRQIDMEQNAIRTYCGRAVARGLLARTDGNYQAVTGWREMASKAAPIPVPVIEIAPVRAPYIPKRHALDSWLGVGRDVHV
jgi:hypothetical protein